MTKAGQGTSWTHESFENTFWRKLSSKRYRKEDVVWLLMRQPYTTYQLEQKLIAIGHCSTIAKLILHNQNKTWKTWI